MATSSIRSATPSEVPAGRRALPDGLALVRGLVRLGEGLAYSSGLAALVGGAMTWAVGRTLGSPSVPSEAAIVACGAFVIYNVDRLRDLARDGSSSPARSAFVARNRPALVGATGLAGLALGALLAMAPTRSVALCLAVGSVGLLHRRLKNDVRFKVAYVSAAWTAACVGLPWLAGVDGVGGVGGGEGGAAESGARTAREALAWALLFVGSAVTANLIASNLREGKCRAAAWAPARALESARAIAITGLLAALIAPEGLASLAWIPALEVAALGCFRRTERFGHLAVDGALLLGALFAIGSSSG